MSTETTVENIFVGRDDSLSVLRSYAHQLLATGKSKIVLVAGDSGIGKTTFVNFLLKELEKDLIPISDDQKRTYILRGNCNEIAASRDPYGPFAELLNGLAEQPLPIRKVIIDWAKDLSPKLLEGIPALGPVLGKIWSKLLGINGDESGKSDTAPVSNQGYYIVKFIEKISQLFNLILFIDDLHWADESSLNLIFQLARNLQDSHILFIGAYRPHDILTRDQGIIHPFARLISELRRYGLCDEIFLERFTLSECKDFINSRFPENHFATPLFAMLYGETNGVPFFLDEVTQHLMMDGHIYQINGAWESKEITQIPIPRGPLAIVQARLNALSDDQMFLMQVASVIGQRFHSIVLAEVLNKDHIDVLRILREIEKNIALLNI